jgi:hypothetical protein
MRLNLYSFSFPPCRFVFAVHHHGCLIASGIPLQHFAIQCICRAPIIQTFVVCSALSPRVFLANHVVDLACQALVALAKTIGFPALFLGIVLEQQHKHTKHRDNKRDDDGSKHTPLFLL